MRGIRLTLRHVAAVLHGEPPAPRYEPGPAVATSHCQTAGRLPDRRCSPGDTVAGLRLSVLCHPGYPASVRNVSARTKRRIYAAYGMTPMPVGTCEIDHIVPLGLGGSNAGPENLWPQLASPRPGFHEKDLLEWIGRKMVCDGRMTLNEAQRRIATNWVAWYDEIRQTAGASLAEAEAALSQCRAEGCP